MDIKIQIQNAKTFYRMTMEEGKRIRGEGSNPRDEIYYDVNKNKIVSNTDFIPSIDEIMCTEWVESTGDPGQDLLLVIKDYATDEILDTLIKNIFLFLKEKEDLDSDTISGLINRLTIFLSDKISQNRLDESDKEYYSQRDYENYDSEKG